MTYRNPRINILYIFSPLFLDFIYFIAEHFYISKKIPITMPYYPASDHKNKMEDPPICFIE